MICSVLNYQRITGDSASDPAAVTTALQEAQRTIEDRTDRFFEQVSRTETLPVREGGRLYPRGLPLVSVTSPSGASIDGQAIVGASGSWLDPDLALNPPVGRTARSAVTYVGGYAPEEMPTEIVAAVAELAYLALHPVLLVGVPAGVTSISFGSQSYSGASLGGVAQLPAHIRGLIRLWQRREV